jgi:hypothetical protein
MVETPMGLMNLSNTLSASDRLDVSFAAAAAAAACLPQHCSWPSPSVNQPPFLLG